MMQKIEGYIEEIIFNNKENGYTVLTLVDEGKEKTCIGFFGQLNKGEYLEAEVEGTHHPTYGEQYNIRNYKITMPKNIIAIERYLGSGLIKGVGPSLAKKIVKRFKLDTFRIIDEEPERLVEIKGISEKKARSIAELFDEKKEMRQAMIFLQEYGISTTYAVKIYQKYKEGLYQLIKTNPYKLAEDINGIGFKMSDDIAHKIGITPTSDFRIKSGIEYILIQAAVDGHIFLPKDNLLKKVKELLDVPLEIIEHALIEMQVNQNVIQKTYQEEVLVYSKAYYFMELSIARKIYDLTMAYDINEKHIDEKLDKIEKIIQINLDYIQKEAVKEALYNSILIITGGPGTGKTTTINAIIECFNIEGLDILLAAPTGRAAKRMTEATGVESQTIHRLLEISYLSDEENSKLVFEKNEDNPLEADVVIVDEMSMVDVVIMHHLLKAIAPGTRLIMVGDVDQLPSVGPGNVLKDLITSNKLKVVKLTRIFRQAHQSHIIMNAHKINEGKYIDLNNRSKDFFFIKRLSIEPIIEELISLIKNRLPKFTGHKVFDGLQILTPMRKGALGVEQLNSVVQKIVNPSNKSKQEKLYRFTMFREGDKVMQIKNNYQLVWEIKNKHGYTTNEGTGVYNGDIGVIENINHLTEKVKIIFDDGKIVYYEFNQLDELELAYAVTIHKSQGSEYPVVIMPILNGPSLLMNRNLLYTAITRAKQYVVIIGNDTTIQNMIQNEREINRYSSLKIRIREIFDVIEGV
ncbi:MAG: ATP-dependent RecD-like DNA helicase [Eubacteriales bacterium]